MLRNRSQHIIMALPIWLLGIMYFHHLRDHFHLLPFYSSWIEFGPNYVKCWRWNEVKESQPSPAPTTFELERFDFSQIDIVLRNSISQCPLTHWVSSSIFTCLVVHPSPWWHSLVPSFSSPLSHATSPTHGGYEHGGHEHGGHRHGGHGHGGHRGECFTGVTIFRGSPPKFFLLSFAQRNIV